MSSITGVSVAHQRASVEQVEAACEGQQRQVEALLAHDRIREAFVLETCNRAEAYVVTDDPETGRRILAAALPALPDDVVRYMDHERSLRHLMRLAAGLESLVLGEDQILGQMREAYETARGVGALGELLDPGVTKALHVGERARNETAINEGVVSLGSAAVELAASECDLTESTALVVGAGEMGTLAARALAAADVDELVVANRTVPHAEHVASEVAADAESAGLAALSAVLAAADVAVTAPGSDDHVVAAAALTDAGETLVVDIAQPRDVSPAAADVDGVDLHDLDDLKAVTARSRERRRAAAEAVEALVDEEFDRLLDQYKRGRADDVIAAMYESAEGVKQRELREALAKLESAGDLTDDQRAVVESLADALVGQLLAAPTKSLREAAAVDDWTTIDTALQLFDPEFGPESPGAPVADPPASDGPAADGPAAGGAAGLPEDAEPPAFVDAEGTDDDAD